MLGEKNGNQFVDCKQITKLPTMQCSVAYVNNKWDQMIRTSFINITFLGLDPLIRRSDLEPDPLKKISVNTGPVVFVRPTQQIV